jgi:hypothetical protein
MIKYIQDIGRGLNPVEIDFMERLANESQAYIKTVINVVREPILILNNNLRVVVANESFYRTFQVEPTDTENVLVYELGNGQWNIPALRELLEEILPRNNFFKDFNVIHEFPFIGRKSMTLNARQIHSTDHTTPGLFPPALFLAIEDSTPMMAIAETLIAHVNELGSKNAKRILNLETQILAPKENNRKLKKVPLSKLQTDKL